MTLIVLELLLNITILFSLRIRTNISGCTDQKQLEESWRFVRFQAKTKSFGCDWRLFFVTLAVACGVSYAACIQWSTNLDVPYLAGI